jgi:hypothetical protein
MRSLCTFPKHTGLIECTGVYVHMTRTEGNALTLDMYQYRTTFCVGSEVLTAVIIFWVKASCM